ncbi:MAG TPA: tRNA uridine-5-carboxymethylaminomethyl(34) synthesis GTPase MnmE, partial [Xanthomonadales bacterium]|nr:tRNA uridine-5-carboxymethylaminomethyl(34) synthesis GTPase MnmE [Xanthomonadales bacterium]
MATSPDRPSPRPAEPAEDGRADPIWVGDTIAAIATAAGTAGIGIVRLSGPDVPTIARSLLGRPPRPRHAHYLRIHDGMGHVLDDGLLLLFPGPASYTGEDTLELQTHGNPHLLNAVLRRCLELGARPARPGEFTERAFLNGKLDLAQAEAVADLIAAGSDAAARAARRSLDGLFSERIADLADRLTDLRVYVEAAIDFPEEEIDVLAGPELGSRLADVRNRLHRLLAEAERGVR